MRHSHTCKQAHYNICRPECKGGVQYEVCAPDQTGHLWHLQTAREWRRAEAFCHRRGGTKGLTREKESINTRCLIKHLQSEVTPRVFTFLNLTPHDSSKKQKSVRCLVTWFTAKGGNSPIVFCLIRLLEKQQLRATAKQRRCEGLLWANRKTDTFSPLLTFFFMLTHS